MCQLKGHLPPGRPRSANGATRGLVKGFSRRSRQRLFVLVNSINRDKLKDAPLFVTLTYPGKWPADPAVWKRHLDTLQKRLRRRYPEVAGIWRLEYQERGAPHFHTCLFGVDFLPHEWLAQAWYEIVASGDERHLAAGTEVKRARSWGDTCAYLAKYVGKVDQARTGAQLAGRVWGTFGTEHLPIDYVKCVVSAREFWSIRRALRNYLKGEGYRRKCRGQYQGLTVFIGNGASLRLIELPP